MQIRIGSIGGELLIPSDYAASFRARYSENSTVD